MMKKITIGFFVLFLGSQLMLSCSSDSAILNQFAKRKYLKRFKPTKANKKTVAHYKKDVVEKKNNQNEVYASKDNSLMGAELTQAATNTLAIDGQPAPQKIRRKPNKIQPFKKNAFKGLTPTRVKRNNTTLDAPNPTAPNYTPPPRKKMNTAEIVLAVLMLFILTPCSSLFSDSRYFLPHLIFYGAGIYMILVGISRALLAPNPTGVNLILLGFFLVLAVFIHAIVLIAENV